jgi:DNA-binding NarL/FixJ family response regulator
MLRVVLIDDAKQVRDAVAELIRNAGHEIVGEATMGQAGSGKPSLSGRISSSWTGACQAWMA